jgi:hypothetical protein
MLSLPLLVSPPTKEILYCLASALSDWEKSASHFLSTLGTDHSQKENAYM